MKKGEILFTLVVISILLISVSFVIAESNETNETETTNETESIGGTESEECATSINIIFNQDVYYVGDMVEITTEVFDSQGNLIPNFVFYVTIYDTMWHSPFSQETGADGYFRQSAIARIEEASGVRKAKYKVYTQETDSCGSVEDIAEIEIITNGDTGSEPEQEEGTESISVPTVCASSISINFDKTGYAPGDSFNVEVGVFDSQGNPLSNYAFYVRMYDTMWHSPDLQSTGADGYFRHTGTAEKSSRGVTKGIFNAYTKEIGSCGSVEDTIELNLQGPEPEPVPCGMGTCIPVEETPVEPIEIPDEKIFYTCNGCELEEKCYPMGYRKTGKYCSDNNEFIDQSNAGICDNNFECNSNLCISDECVEEGLLKKIINWFRKLFGGEPKSPELEECSELLIEKNIGNYKYNQTLYGFKEAQVPVYSNDGEQEEIVKCCAVQYLSQEGVENMGMVCPFDNKEDVENSIKWLLIKNPRLTLGEYKGENVLNDQDNVIAWTSDTYIIATGAQGEGTMLVEEDIASAYLKKYPNDLES